MAGIHPNSGIAYRFLFGALLVGTLSLVSAGSAFECQPEIFYLFGEEARAELEKFNRRPTDDSLVVRLVLLHNLAFEKDEQARREAEELLERNYPPESRTPLVEGYAGSLRMIRVSHRSYGSKVARTVSPFNKSPRAEAVEGFHQITAALVKDPDDPILRLLRSTAGAETVEYLPQFFADTRADLEWLTRNGDPNDRVLVFMNELNWAKYFYKLAGNEGRPKFMKQAWHHLECAAFDACTPVYQRWLATWRERLVHRSAEAPE